MRRLAVAVVIVVILAADQETKSLARQHLRAKPPRHFSALTLIYTDNRGAFLSLGALFRGQLQRGDEIALAAIIGGGVGNLVDRLRFAGRVTDFLYLSAGPLHTGVFNIADMAITLGVIWLMVSWMFSTRARVS